MANEPSQTSPLHREVLYPRPDLPLAVRRDVPYSSSVSDGRLMDIYSPFADASLRPAIVIASGYPAAGLRQHLGCSGRELPAITSWARLLGTEGIAAVIYDAVEPAADLHAVLTFLRTEGAQLGIDSNRLGVLACSGNAPVALAAVAAGGLKCAIFLYGFTLDGPDNSTIRTASRHFGFANPSSQLTTEDLPASTHLLFARAGNDALPGLNEALDRFTADALRSNLPITIVNHSTGPHAFDLIDESNESRNAIGQVLGFTRLRLMEQSQDHPCR